MPEDDPFLENPVHCLAVVDVLDELSAGTSPRQAAINSASSDRLRLFSEAERSAIAFLATNRAVEIQEDNAVRQIGNIFND